MPHTQPATRNQRYVQTRELAGECGPRVALGYRKGDIAQCAVADFDDHRAGARVMAIEPNLGAEMFGGSITILAAMCLVFRTWMRKRAARSAESTRRYDRA